MPTAELPSRSRPACNRAYLLFLALLAATLIEMAWYYPRLPARVASHFDAAGRADAFLPKAMLLQVQLLAVGVMAALFALLPALLGLLPDRLLNLPNKAYWLAPERRAHTRAMLRGSLVGFGNGMLLFLLLVFREALHASLLPVPRMSKRIWLYLILLAAWSVWWTVRFLRALRRPA